MSVEIISSLKAMKLHGMAATAATPGRERFRRSAKALVRVGGESDGVSLRSAGQRMDITPVEDPPALAAGDPLRFVLRFDSQPQSDGSYFWLSPKVLWFSGLCRGCCSRR